MNKKKSNRNLEPSSFNAPCKICQMIGHKEGFCATYFQKIKIACENANSILFYCSLDNWQKGHEMVRSKYDNMWILKKIFPIGKYYFKFKVDNNLWVTSDFYDVQEINGIINNYICVDAYQADNYILSNFIKDNQVFLKIQFILREWNLQMILEKYGLKKFNLKDIQLQIFGEWDNWKDPIEMIKIVINGVLIFVGKKVLNDIPKGFYQYKFKLNENWVLDPFRTRIKDANGNFNHFFRYKKTLDNKVWDLSKFKINFKKICLNEIGLIGLSGHSLNIVNDTIYIIGGIGRNNYSNTIYTINLHDWNIKEIDMDDPNGPDLIAFHKTIIYGDKIIVYGGQTERNVSSKYHTFNTFTKKWTFFNLKNNIKKEQFSSAYKKDSFRIYFFGGYYYHPDLKEEKTFNDLSVLHLDLMYIEKLETKNPPKPRLNHSANMFDWNMYIFGGTNIQNYKYEVFNDLHFIDLSDHENLVWKEIKPDCKLPEPRYGHLALAYKNNIIIHGGKTNLGIRKEIFFSDFWVFNIQNEIWTQILYEGDNEIKRAHHSGSIYKDQIYIFGGKLSKKIQKDYSNEIFIIPLLD